MEASQANLVIPRIDPREEEICVLCNEPRGYPKGTPIDARPQYIEGVGDVCDKCHKEICEQQ